MTKKTLIRMIACLLALMFLFAGCQKSPSDVTPTPDTASPGVSPDDAPVRTAETSAQALGLSLDDLVFTVDGSDVTLHELLYWANSVLTNMLGGTTGEIDWTLDTGSDKTLAQFVLDEAVNSIMLYRLVEAKCQEMNITLSDTDMESIEAARTSSVEYFGGEEGYAKALSEMFLTDELYNYMIRVSYLYTGLFYDIYGTNAENCSDEEALAFGAENGFLRAKHLLLSKNDAEGNPIPEEEYAAKYEKLQEYHSMLDNSDDPIALFETLMNDHSEDPGLAGNPDGYQWIGGAMMESFESATKGLDDFGYSDIFEMSTYGYTMVMRLPLDPDAVAINDSYGYTLRMNAAMSNFDTLLSSWSEDCVVDYKPAYEKIDLTKCL